MHFAGNPFGLVISWMSTLEKSKINLEDEGIADAEKADRQGVGTGTKSQGESWPFVLTSCRDCLSRSIY